MAFKYNPFSGTLDMTLSGYTYLIGTTNPDVTPGVKAQIGLLYNNNTTGILWHKFGINDTDWAAITSLPYGLAELNLQTGLSQTLVTGATGTDFNIVSATNVHTFNLPTASFDNSGKLSSGDFQHFDNTKNCMGALGAIDLGNFTGTIIGNNKTVKQALQSLETTEDHLITLSGVVKDSDNLGTFTGTIIPINQTIKASIQAVSTTEDNLITLSGVAKDAVNLGTFPSGVIIPDNSTIKDALAVLDQTQSNLVSLTGVTKDSINFGSFTGTNIPANQDTKQSLQALSNAIDGKQATITTLPIANGGTNSSTALTGSKVIVSDSTSIKESSITTTALSYLDASSSIQTQLNGKEPTVTKGNLTEATSSVLTISSGTGAVIGTGTTIQVKQSGSGQSGYLSNTDWSTFNGKLSSVGTIDSQTKAANGAVVNSTSLVLQTADATNPGLMTAAKYNELIADSAAFSDMLEPTGFIATSDGTTPIDSQISFVDATAVFTIQPKAPATSFSFYLKGTKYTKNSAQNVTLSGAEGLHYIYFNTSGVLSSVTTFIPELLTQNAIVSIIYYDAANLKGILISDERHMNQMDGETHLNLHLRNGTLYISGMALGNFVADGSGSLNTEAQFSVALGALRDEDILINTAAIGSTTGLPIYYRSGAAGNWRRIVNAGYSVTNTGTGRLAYNQNTGSTWQLSEVGNNNFALYHIFATNCITNQYIAIPGQTTYTTIALARTGSSTEMANLILAGLPSAEYLPIASVIFQTATAYSNAVKAIVRTVSTGVNYVDFRFSKLSPSAISIASHSNLTGLTSNDHHQYTLVGLEGIQAENSFSIANNQSSAANITGFVFTNGVTRAFEARVVAVISATTPLYEEFKLYGVQKTSSWDLSVTSSGDNTGLSFTITNAGQVQYFSPNFSGFTLGILKFTAITSAI